jgi:hypothetical protein
VQAYEVGDRVSHDRWGLGRVIDLAADRSLTVAFGDGHTERLEIPYPKLHKL